MITLKQATIHKYKSIESDQTFEIEEDVTVLVGMNESGKTSILEALAKSNYFTEDKAFKFNATHDYPRKEKKKMDKEGVVRYAITCVYEVDDELISEINEDVGKDTFSLKTLNISTSYKNNDVYQNFIVNAKALYKTIAEIIGCAVDQLDADIAKIKNEKDFAEFLKGEKAVEKVEELREFQKYFKNELKWDNPIQEYVARVWIKPNLPKYLYYDEYYNLPSRISIEKLQAETLKDEDMKTAKALLELADINLDELINSNDFEDYKAELEATISEELFEYEWH